MFGGKEKKAYKHSGVDILILIAFLASIGFCLYYILSAQMIAGVNSDTVSGLILVREGLKERSLIPQNWCYSSTQTFPLWTGIYIFIRIFVTDNILALKIIRAFAFLFMAAAAYLFGRKVLNLNNRYTLLLLAIWFSPISSEYIFDILSNGYAQKVGQWFLLVFLGYQCVDRKLKVQYKYLIALVIAAFLFITGDVRYLIIFVVPWLFSVAWVWIEENRDIQWKECLKYIARFLIPIGSILLALVLGVVFVKIAYRNIPSHEQLYTTARLLDLNNEEEALGFFKAVGLLVKDIFVGMGYYNGARQISIPGIVSMGVVATTVLLLIVFPALMTKKYSKYQTEVKRLIVFYWTLWAVELLTIAFSDNGLVFRHVLYPVLLGIGMSLYFVVNEIIERRDILSTVFALAIGCYIAMNWVITPVNTKAAEKVAERNELYDFLESHDLKYGYATYWNANIHTAMSNFRIEIYPLKLGELEPDYIFAPDQFYLSAETEESTFLMFTKEEWNEVAVNFKFLLKYGDYTELLMVDDYVILKYDYNVARNFNSDGDIQENGADYVGDCLYSEDCYVDNDRVIVPAEQFMYGPYKSLKAGHYRLTVECEVSGEAALEVKAFETGATHFTGTVQNGVNVFEFDVLEEIEAVEFCIQNTSEKDMAIKSVVLQQFNAYEPGDMVSIGNCMLVNDQVSTEDGHFVLKKDGVIFGPYWSMKAGDYRIRVDVDMEETDSAVLRITSDVASTEILSVPLTNGENEIPFTLGTNENGVEFSISNLGDQKISADIYYEVR